MNKNKETIVLVNPPNKKIVLRDLYSSTISKGTYNWPCTDLLVLSGLLKNRYDIKLIDANTLGLSVQETVSEIGSHNPLGVCFAFGNSVKEDDYSFIKKVREALPEAKIVGTGGLLYHNSENELQQHPEFDACLINFTTDDIVKYFSGEWDHLRNITHRVDGKIVKTPLEYPENNFAYSVPLHEQLPLHKYRLSHGKQSPLTSILTSYGCPWTCSFCVSEKINFRYRNADNIIEELGRVKELGVKEVFFRDNVFCVDKKQGYSIMEKMVANDFGLTWVSDTRANIIDDPTAKLMKKSGCHALHFGVESASNKTLKDYDKKLTVDKIRQAFKICRENDIKTVGYFILGLPGETAGDVLATIDFAIDLDCDYASFNMPLPIFGTDLREEAIKNDWIEADHEQIYDGSLTPLINTSSLTADQIRKFRSMAYRKFYFRPRYFLKSIKRIETLYQMKMLFSEFIHFFDRYGSSSQSAL